MSNGNGDSVLDFNEAIVYMAKLFGCYVVDTFDCGICGQNMSTFLQDGLHPNTTGGELMAKYINNAIRKMAIYDYST